MPPVPEPVLAITPASDRMHIGKAKDVVKHVTAEEPPPDSGDAAVEWEYFDVNGAALEKVGTGTAAVLQPTGAAAPNRTKRQILVSRIDLVLAHAQLRLDKKLAEMAAGGVPLTDQEWVRMMRVQGELSHVLTMLGALGRPLAEITEDPHTGDWWHNYWAH